MPCESCPCPDTCIARPAFCEWAKTGDPVLLRHIRDVSARSAEAPGPPPLAKPSYPPLAKQVRNLFGSAARFVASGLKVASEEEQARRLDICHACSEYVAEDDRCRVCGCSTTWKAKLISDHCPINKW